MKLTSMPLTLAQKITDQEGTTLLTVNAPEDSISLTLLLNNLRFLDSKTVTANSLVCQNQG
jgi:hypothetical protein